MRLTAHVHLYPPNHCAGAEMMLHAILTWMLRHGHAQHAQVITTRPPRRHDTLDGVHVQLLRDPRRARLVYDASDVIITHLDVTRTAVALARRTARPLVHLVHNDRQLDFHGVRPDDAALVVVNSRWIADKVRWPGDSVVVHPPVWAADYPPEPGPHDAVVLVNMMAAKGAGTFFALARRFPDVRFIGVRGAYGSQEPVPGDLRNVEVWPHTPDIRAVYREARVVVMPSTYESWGRVAVEAAAAGVPVVAAHTPGLVEAGVAAAYLDPGDVDAWARVVGRLVRDDDAHAAAAAAGHERAVTLDRLSRLQLTDLAEKFSARTCARR